MSTLQINRTTLEKLTHESLEIRLRTLEQVAAKLERAQALNEEVEFKPSDLCKQLIRWFGHQPLQVPLKVLQILKSILQSPLYGGKITEKLGLERILKELNKIYKLVEPNAEEMKIVNDIKRFLEKQKTVEEKNTTEELSNLVGLLNLNPKESDIDASYNTEDYEIPWSRPSTSDYTSMKFLADILVNPFASTFEIQNAVQHLQLTMSDYPAEYLLQAPHIFRNLLQIYDERQHNGERNVHYHVDSVAAALLKFLFILEKRLKMKNKSVAYPFSSHSINTSSAQNKSSQAPCQLKVTKALPDLLEASFYHLEMYSYQSEISPVVWEVIFKILQLYERLEIQVDIRNLYKVASIVAKLSSKFPETEQCARLRLHQMQLIFLLQDIAQINGYRCKSLEALEVYEPILRDYSLKCLFPERHQELKELLLKMDKSLNEKFRLMDKYEKSFKLSIEMLVQKRNSSSSCEEIIRDGYDLCIVLEKLQSQNLVDILFNAIITAIPMYPANPQLKSHAIDLLLKLLNLTFMPLKSYTYDKMTLAFKRHIACLMNGDCYTMECSNSLLLDNHIVGVPLNLQLLLQILHDSFETSDENIQRNCFRLLELLLQSQSLFSTKWCNLLTLLVPLMPLLNCCTMSKKLMDLLLKHHDPDLKQLPFVTVLQGNLGFLFHSNAQRRSEALTRLIYSLNAIKGSELYMPNLLEISDTIPNDICLLKTPREYGNIFTDHSSLRADVLTSLNNLLQLLESPDVEPLIRKTSLMQINVLCSNWHITKELCNAGASYLILQALENSLQHSSSLDYPDSAIPAISILNKVLLYDSSLRCELADTPNIYVLLLRALMMYHHDIQMQQDASMCIFQLLYAPQLIATEKSIEAPLILGNIQMPLNINLRSAVCQNLLDQRENVSMVFATALEETQYWRMVIADTSCGGLQYINQKSCSKQLQLDIREDLKLTPQDIRFIRATQPGVSLQRLLKAASNATEHSSLIQACHLLKQQLLLPRLRNTLIVTPESSMALSQILQKYLQLPPGNNKDLELYENLLDLVIFSVRISLTPIISDLSKAFLKDPRHAFITMLTQTEEIPLRIYCKITTLLELLFTEKRSIFETNLSSSDCSSFYSQLFDLLIERSLQLFEIRDLVRVRCLLSLMVALTSCNLDMPDQLIFFYCRRFAQLSLALKSFTQTGAQWHRDCFVAILQLSQQMQNPNENFRLSAGFVKYLSGLCGHNDVQVRILAWSILHVVAKTTAIELRTQEEETERKSSSSDIAGLELLCNVLAYLPGGFMACCITSLLDLEEVICVRQLAGHLLAILISKHKEVEDIEKLLDQNKFVRSITEALNSSKCILSEEMPKDFDCNDNIITCDLINCYTRICIEVSRRSPTFLSDLCTRSFMFKLYEIIKQPIPSDASSHEPYISMIGSICRLYAMCYADNFIFLQRTICRDAIWINSFCQLLFQTVATFPQDNAAIIVDLLQFLMVLSKDSTALEQLSTKMCEYSTEIVELFKFALAVANLNTRLQLCSLSVLSLLLIKSQPELGKEESINILTLFESQNVMMKSMQRRGANGMESDNKENLGGNDRMKERKMDKKEQEKETNHLKSSISEHLCLALIPLFNHLYTIKACKFTTPPTGNQQQVTETLALLLKQSPVAQKTAQDLKFHDKIVKIFKHFFEEFSTTSCTTYVKRHGETKKMVVIKNLQLVLKLILNWHSSPAMMITDDNLATELCRIVIQIWPWLAHSVELKFTVLQVCAFLSESSLVMCRKFSTLNSSTFPHSVLQLVAKMVMAETLKIKAASSDCSPVISAGLRVLMNCCSCVEGRSALNKSRALDIFDSLHPFNPKSPQLKTEILILWLQFWELYTRYDEGAHVHHLNALCSVINKSAPGSTTRLFSLRILRNMTFLAANRSSLITSTDFIYTVNEILSQPLNTEDSDCSVEEQFIVCVALWKLISGGIKFVAMIRGTKLAKHLKVLYENLSCILSENAKQVKCAKDLLNVLDIIFKIFNN